MNIQKGFTIIELIVVVAIIAVLAAIILVNVTAYNNKGKDAAIKGNLATLLSREAPYYDINSNYGNFCGSVNGATPVGNAINDPRIGGNFVCNVKADNTAWCACSPEKLTSSTVFCVDSTGTKKESVTTDCATKCPALQSTCQ